MVSELTETQKRVIYQLQGDLPDGSEPYDILAERAAMPVEEFLKVARELVQQRYFRRIGATINHLEAGFVANAMCVWNIPADRADDAGEVIAGFDEVTHCFRRPVSDMWPYAIFCMIHGRRREESESVAQRIAEAVKPIDYRLIYSTVELKKCSVTLSLPESSCADRR